MRLEVKNIGKISHAEVNMQGLTVIVGNNSTGKSTISKSLYAVIHGFHNFTGKINAKKRSVLINNLRQWINPLNVGLRTFHRRYRNKVKYMEIMPSVRAYIDLFDRFYDRHTFMTKNDSSKQEEFNYFVWMESVENFRKQINEVFSLMELQEILSQVGEDSLIRDKMMEIDKLYEKIEKETEEQKISREILNEIVQSCFSNKFSTQFNNEATEIKLYPINENVEHYARIFRKKNSEFISDFSYMDFEENIVYIQPIHILDDNDSTRVLLLGQRGEKIQDKLLLQLGVEENTKNIETKEQVSYFRKRIDEILSKSDEEFDNEPIGDAEQEEVPFYGNKFTYKDSQLNETIDFTDVASGIKNIAILKKLIENGVLHRGSLLIMDEPEVNLHPDWQMKLAEILVMLKEKMHIRVLINTHSPYFMRAIECYSDLYGVFNDLNIYRTVRDTKTEHQYTVENISEIENGIEYLYYQMSRPFAKLQEMLEEKRDKEVKEDE